MSFKVSYDKDTLNLQKLGEIVYEKTDLADFRSNSDDKGLVDYTWQNASDNNSVLTFDFKGKNIELEDLPYTGDITKFPSFVDAFVTSHNIIYGDINTAIENSETEINDTNKYKITFNGKLKLPRYSAGLFTNYNKFISNGKYISEIDLTKADMNNIVNASYMFYLSENIDSISLPNNFTGENIVITSSMFSQCKGLTSIDLSKFTGENVTSAGSMFEYCIGLTSLDLSKFTGANLRNSSSMFFYCSSLNSLDLRSFTGENLTNAVNMFAGCSKLNTLIMKGSAINIIISLNETRLSLNSGVTVDNDKTYSCTCTFSSGVKITEVQEISA